MKLSNRFLFLLLFLILPIAIFPQEPNEGNPTQDSPKNGKTETNGNEETPNGKTTGNGNGQNGSGKKEESLEEKHRRFLEAGQINVIGSKDDDLKKIPGSANVIGPKVLKESNPVDSMEALRRVPGATLRYQDAAGLTPNIAFRGVSNEESRKTLILEDGVLTSLSPYGQPESYYSPQLDRMERVEIIKGSGAILFGPSTLGGIVNFVTRKPPVKPTFDMKVIGGNNGFFSTFMQYGGTQGNTGYDVSYLHKEGKGYRDFQGFRVDDFYGKLVHKLGEKDTISLKVGHNDQDAQSTYLGLTQGLFWANPRINPAKYDRKILTRDSIVISEEHSFSKDWKLVSRLYGTNATRNWQRQDWSYNNLDEFGRPALPPGDTFAIFAPRPIGNRPGDVIYMRNSSPQRNQFFRTGGVELRLEGTFRTFEIKHELIFGSRAHYEDSEVRFVQVAYPFLDKGFTTTSQMRMSRAYSAYIQDTISLTEKFKVIPGVRYEHITQGVYNTRRPATAKDVLDGRAGTEGDIILVQLGGETYTKILLPGMGLTYDLTRDFVWFAGAHTGFSPPTFSTAISPSGADYRLKAEQSNNYETGVRGNITRYFYMQTAVFAMYFQNQIINTSEVGAEAGSRPVNSGKSIHRGVENSFAFDFGKFSGSRWEVPLEINYTYLDARSVTYVGIPTVTNADGSVTIQNRPSMELDANGNILKVDTNRNILPYAPRNTFLVSLGCKSPIGVFARAEYQYFDKQFSDLQNRKNESADGNSGVIPAYGIVNANMGYEAPGGKWSVFINAKNLQDRHYISGRLPIGIQQGPYRQINIGVSFKFD
ncbi:TonB-dependent receptor [Leptospira perolatii]|uniref:TonB-dependent receptor n=1 Tax=Leptospira perolatii TaxID=2023191 RepID=A0A2M9ZQB5_9LEPT|nr:TonB-dependent receptor [Leptospira perolatii]PJZ68236.1 TonB-dependent receptor [Leptospira perolatii]PJZ74161.1 TonB-dependent receptor [Leptospira perolatii]